MYKTKILMIVIIGLLLFSCGNNNSPKGGSVSGVVNGTPDKDWEDKPDTSIHNKVVTIDGIEREFSIYVPSTLTNNASIIFLFHGSVKLGLSPIHRYKPAKFSFNKIAKNNNIVMVYPVGIKRYGELKWDYSKNSSDLKLFDAISSYLKNDFKNDYKFSLNMKKLYVTGYSAGGIFSFSLAGFRASKIAAATPLSAQFGLINRNDNKYVSFIQDNISIPLRAYNGTTDRKVNYESAYNNMKQWHIKENKGSLDNLTTSNIQIDKISGPANNQRVEKYDVNITIYKDGISDLELYSFKGISHFSDYYNLSKSMWNFMDKYEIKN